MKGGTFQRGAPICFLLYKNLPFFSMFMIDSRGINLLPNLAATALGSRSFLYPLPLPAPPFIPSLFFFFFNIKLQSALNPTTQSVIIFIYSHTLGFLPFNLQCLSPRLYSILFHLNQNFHDCTARRAAVMPRASAVVLCATEKLVPMARAWNDETPKDIIDYEGTHNLKPRSS